MSKLPRTIHPLQPRALRERWAGQVRAVELPRLMALRDELRHVDRADAPLGDVAEAQTRGDDAGGVFDVSVWIERDLLGLIHLRMRLCGSVDLTCQRCLQGLEWAIDLDTDVLVVESGRVPERDDLEFVEVDDRGTLDVFEAIDEELVLALPTVPRHDACASPASLVAF